MGESLKSSTKVRHFCRLCTKNYAYSSGLSRHMGTFHINDMVPVGFRCQKCQKTFPSARSLGVHRFSCSRNHKRDRHEIVSSQWEVEQQLARMNTELERVQTELRITIILKNDLEVKLDRTQKELIQLQTKVYTTSKKHEKIMNYIDWLGM